MDEQQSPFPQPTAAQPTGQDGTVGPAKRRRGHRLLATVTATAVVAGVGGVGAGYALGHGFGSAGTSQTTTGSSGRSNVSQQGGTGTVPIPGNGGWSWSDGDGFSVPSLPDGGYGDGSPSQGSSSDTTSSATDAQLTGLVRVVTSMKYDGGKAVGTGMVLTSDGEVVTNHHVVAGATSVKVKVMSTGTTYTAQVVGTDAKDDVAVLQLVGASGLATVTPDTNGIATGDAVTAVGDANGAATFSAATGTVLAKSQTITTQTEGAASGERLTGLLQISSDVVSGDSGGATYDANGQVVGMTTAASSGSPDVVGYAVPIAKVLKVAGDLEGGVTSTRYDYGYPAFLGVGLGRTGTTVQGVYKSTPAAGAGIAAGDTITAVDGTTVSTSAALRQAVAAHSPGDQVTVTWTDTTGSSHTATVTLAQGPVA
jgi:S1-C subfamily serine protease